MKGKIKEIVNRHIVSSTVAPQKLEAMIRDLNWYFVNKLEDEKSKTGVKDKNGREILFGDKIRFSNKFAWYGNEYLSDFWRGNKTWEQIREEIEKRPYEERIVEDITDYEWLLDDDIQKYWEVVE